MLSLPSSCYACSLQTLHQCVCENSRTDSDNKTKYTNFKSSMASYGAHTVFCAHHQGWACDETLDNMEGFDVVQKLTGLCCFFNFPYSNCELAFYIYRLNGNHKGRSHRRNLFIVPITIGGSACFLACLHHRN